MYKRQLEESGVVAFGQAGGVGEEGDGELSLIHILLINQTDSFNRIFRQVKLIENFR